MDLSSAPFKSPRPPAPRRARSHSLSKQSSRQSLRDDFNNAASVEPVPPVPAQHASVGLGVSSLNMNSKNNNNTIASAAESMYGGEDSSRSTHNKRIETSSTMLTGNANTSSAAVLAKLEGLLIAKSNEIQLAGRLGEALLTQQAELETRIRELEDEVRRNDDHASVFGNGTRETRAANQYGENNDDDSDIESNAILDERVKSKLQELESEMQRWEKGNEQIYKEVGVPSGTGSELVRQASSASMRTDQPSTSLPKSSSQNGLYGLGTSEANEGDSSALSPSTSRRQRNAQHRANDIEFATEIGQSLLVEVRRLQALLTERDTQLAASKNERDGMERSMESLAGGLKTVEESVDKYREENWNLEVQNQDFKNQLNDLTSNHSKIESERTRLVKELANTRDILDGHKVDNERLATELDALKNKHETDMANMRRTTAGLQREKTDLQSALEAAKNELSLRARGIRRSVSATSNNTLTTSNSHHTPGGIDGDLAEEDEDEEDDVFGTSKRGNRRKTNDHLLDSPSPMFSDADNSVGSNANSPYPPRTASEAEKLRGNLAHAQKTIQTLRAALLREKEARMLLKRKLNGSVASEDDDDDEDLDLDDDESDYEEVDENQPEKRRRTITAASARRGRGGRGGRGGIVASRRGGGLVGRLPRGLEPSRLSSEVPSGDEDDAEGSIVEHDVPQDISISSEMEELASLPDAEDDLAASNMSKGSMTSLAGMDPAFADILPRSSSAQSNNELARFAHGSTRDNRPNSMMFANDLHLLEQIKQQEEEIERLRAIPPAPEPVETKEMAIMTDEIVPPKKEVREIQIQTDPEPIIEHNDISMQTVPEPIIERKDTSMQTAPEAVKEVKEVSAQTQPEPAKESKHLAIQTEPEPVPEVKQFSTQTMASPKKELKALGTQTETPEVHRAEIATMTMLAPPVVAKHIETMTDSKESEHAGTQTVTPVAESEPGKVDFTPVAECSLTALPATVAVVTLPAKVMVDRGLDPRVEWSTLFPQKQDEQDGEVSGNLSAMSFRGTEGEAATPTLESTPTFAAKVLPDEAELAAPALPESSYTHKMRRDDSSISHSFKSFSVRETDYDTATETEGDFEDARETLATFDRTSPGLNKFANMSQSTIMHSAHQSSQESDGESDGSLRPASRYRKTSRTRSREPTIVGPPKPIMVEIGVQTDSIPKTMVTSPTMTPSFLQRQLPRTDDQTLQEQEKRLSLTSFGDFGETTVDSTNTARPAGTGLIFLETVKPSVEAPPNSAATSSSQLSPVPSSSAATNAPPSPISPTKLRSPKMAVPAPPTMPPSRDTVKHATLPTFRPPRPSSPPPKDLLQRAQTPTFLAPGSVGRKRTSTGGDSISTPNSPGLSGNSLMSRNEASYGASAAPLGRTRQNTGPRATVSSAQLRSNPPPIRYQAASTDPTEFGRHGAVTPVNQMMPPPSRFGSTRRQKDQSHGSRASMSSMGSVHSRNLSVASSARTSDVGHDGLPAPDSMAGNGAGLAGSTDPVVIHAITQAMIGEFLFKYTRTTFTKGHSEKRHQRFFWIHPYTKTLYWSNSDPGAAGVNQSKSKSMFIAGVRVEKDTNPNPPGLYQHSIVISTVGRELKLTAPTQERHEMWMTAINYLLARDDGAPVPQAEPGTPSSVSRFSTFGRSVNKSTASLRFRQRSDPMTTSEAGVLTASIGAQSSVDRDSTVVPRNRNGKNAASIYQQSSKSTPSLTPKQQPSTVNKKARKMSTANSLYKRSDTPAAEYENYIAEYGSPRSVRSYRTHTTAGPSAGPEDESLEVVDRRDALGADDAEGYEGLENVRACCNGEHDVGKLSVSRKQHHYLHHHNHQHKQGTPQYDNGTVRSSMRSNSTASKASRRSGRVSAFGPEPPVPSLHDEPASPSLMVRSRSSDLKGLSASLGPSYPNYNAQAGSSKASIHPFKA